MVFNLTPFYPEGGGQVGDTGILSSDNETIEILDDTKKENNLIVHFCAELPKNTSAKFVAKVDIDKEIEQPITIQQHTFYMKRLEKF